MKTINITKPHLKKKYKYVKIYKEPKLVSAKEFWESLGEVTWKPKSYELKD